MLSLSLCQLSGSSRLVQHASQPIRRALSTTTTPIVAAGNTARLDELRAALRRDDDLGLTDFASGDAIAVKPRKKSGGLKGKKTLKKVRNVFFPWIFGVRLGEVAACETDIKCVQNTVGIGLPFSVTILASNVFHALNLVN